MRRSIRLVLLLAVNACGSSGPTAPSGVVPRTTFVSTTGNDRNAGTAGSPWLTLRYAVAQLHAGDTLYIRGGTYTGVTSTIDAALNPVRGGTSAATPITIAGYPSETVIIQPPDGQSGIRLVTATQQYLVFQDLIIDMANMTASDTTGVYVSGGANHNRFIRLEVKNNWMNAMALSDNNGNAPFNEILNCKIHDNGRNPAVNSGYGIYVFTSDNLIEGNEIYNNSGFGIHNYGTVNAARNTFRQNRIHDNGVNGGQNFGLIMASGDGNIASDNLIYGNHGGIQVGYNATNAKVCNNTIYNNTPLEGILIGFGTSAVVRDNNVYGNGTDVVNLGTESQQGCR